MSRFRYVLGAIFGCIVGLSVLREIFRYASHDATIAFLQFWLQDEHAVTALSILALSIIACVALAAWLEIRDIYRACAVKTKDLNDMVRIKTDLLSVAAHEIRSPITSIGWAIKMLLDGEYGQLSEEQKQIFTQMYQSVMGLKFTTNDFLTVARLEGKILELNLVSMRAPDFEARVMDLFSDFHYQMKGKEIHVTRKMSDDDRCLLTFDIERILEVVRNLVENAINYSRRGSSIIVTTSAGQKEYVLSIEDNGIGIPASEQPHIFEKLFRATNARKVQGTGAGLGLYLSKKFVEAHGGRIWFESKEGSGTTFSISLPLKKEGKLEEFFREI